MHFSPTLIAPERLAARRDRVHRSRARWMRRYQHLLVAIDLMAAGIAVAVAFLLRFGIPTDPASVRVYAIVGVLMPPAWVAVVAMNRGYEGRFVGAGPAEFDRLFKAFLYLIALVAIGSYASHVDIARGFVVVALPTALGLDLVGRYIARKYLHRLRSDGRAMTSMLLVGDGPSSCSATWTRSWPPCEAAAPIPSRSSRPQRSAASGCAGSPGSSRAATCRWSSRRG
jgi:hypothetical protein